MRGSVWQRLLGLLSGLLLAGCASLPGVLEGPPAPPEDPAAAAEARALVEALQAANSGLATMKGLGRLTVRHGDRVQLDERMAWVGAPPLRLSVVLFAAGFPALRMAGDGEWLYYQDGQEAGAPVKRIRASDPDLERILSISIQTSDIIALISGRLPIKEHSSARVVPVASGSGRALQLLKGRHVRQTVFFDDAASEARQMQVFDSGTLLYQANFVEMQRVGRYKVPLRLTISNAAGTSVQLLVERYWADVPVSPEMFVLAAPSR
ncbi:MAG: hypothetical protein MUD16_08675 [Desulfobacterales bacterium]|jgi:hypothetical protein|nr:hypothetical protein [Desulfobacterales bacterium]